jgi:hypothetical protein
VVGKVAMLDGGVDLGNRDQPAGLTQLNRSGRLMTIRQWNRDQGSLSSSAGSSVRITFVLVVLIPELSPVPSRGRRGRLRRRACDCAAPPAIRGRLRPSTRRGHY